MYYQCCDCDRSFDSEIKPTICPFCLSGRCFAEISVITAEGRELTYKEYISDMRQHYMRHLPYGRSKKDIEQMDDLDLELMDDILSE